MNSGFFLRLRASPLANALALDAAALAILSLAEQYGLVAQEPSGRVAGLSLVGLAWFTVRIAPRISLGARRAVAVGAALVTLAVGVLHGAGPDVVAACELRVGPLLRAPLREALAAACVSCAAAVAWATSPALRR